MAKSLTATAGDQAGGVAKGAGSGALLGLSTMILGPVLGNLAGGIAGGMVMKDQADIIAFIAGMRLFDALFGTVAAAPTGSGGVM